MKHIQNKNDWFYEFRPQIILAFGIIGLFSKLLVSYGNEPIWFKVSVACGIFLVVMSLKIMSWRREYRTAYRRIPTR